MSLYLGIDTSAYTTSLAVINERGQIIADERIVLPVPMGKRGLRQSEALFLHIKNLPQLFEHIPSGLASRIKAVAASQAPRDNRDSYMPVFLAGWGQAQVISRIMQVPLYTVSHQQGHIAAGIYGHPDLLQETSFLAVHFSGGTSDVMRVTRGGDGFFDIENLVSSSDLHAGQLVDRVGVAMGLPFPSGPALEKLALQAGNNNQYSIPVAVNLPRISFSGAETRAIQMYQQGVPKAEVAVAVLRVVAKTIEKTLLKIEPQKHENKVLLVGGVMANHLIRKRIIDRLEHPAVGMKLFFAEPGLSSDNAIGVAHLAYLLHKYSVRS
ncbi:MAG: peptidase M22 [Syntrophomonadaceae bacterium]|nr:peptidase M22 [Syntrophomonadaceae bacterium]